MPSSGTAFTRLLTFFTGSVRGWNLICGNLTCGSWISFFTRFRTWRPALARWKRPGSSVVPGQEVRLCLGKVCLPRGARDGSQAHRTRP